MAFTYGKQQFELSFPDNWKDETIYSFKGPEDSGVQHGLLVTADENPETDDLTRYAKDRVTVIQNTLTGADVLKQGEKELFSDFPAYEVVYKWVPCEGKILFQKQVWILADGVVYNFTASFSKKTIKTIGREVDQIIESFTLPSASPAIAAPAKKTPIIKKPRFGKNKPAFKKPTVKSPTVKKPPPVKKKPSGIKINRITKK